MEHKNSKLLSALAQIGLAIVSGVAGAFATNAVTPTRPPEQPQQVAVAPRNDRYNNVSAYTNNYLVERPAGSPPEGTYSVSFNHLGEEVRIKISVPDYRILGAPLGEKQEQEDAPAPRII